MHWVAINALGCDALAAPTLDGVVETENDRTRRDKGMVQQAQQQPGARLATPASPAEHAMIIDEVALAAEATDAQDAGHGALARGQDGADEQDLGMAPGAVAKQRRKGYNDRGEAGGQVQHGGVSWRKLRQPTASFASPPALPNHPLEMAKLKLRICPGRRLHVSHVPGRAQSQFRFHCRYLSRLASFGG